MALLADVGDGLLGLLGMLESLGIDLLGSGDDLLFLLGKVLVGVSLLSFFLQEADSLQSALGLNHIGSDSIQVLFRNLSCGVFAYLIVDFFEQFLYFLLLSDIHRHFVTLIDLN